MKASTFSNSASFWFSISKFCQQFSKFVSCTKQIVLATLSCKQNLLQTSAAWKSRRYILFHASQTLGWVELVHTTDESLGPGRYTLNTQRQKDATTGYFSDSNPVIPYIQFGKVTMSRKSHITHKWFLLRGTGMCADWQQLSHHYQVHDKNIIAVLRTLSIWWGIRMKLYAHVIV